MLNFNELPLSEELQKAITDMGFTTPSPIQAEAIPLLLAGHDVIGQAQTGTGKTAAFGLPLLQKIDPSARGVQALILCPTRELAVQVSDELKKLAKYSRGIFISAIYGGDSIERQIRDLRKGVQIVVGTPGRVIDHIERGTLKLDNVKTMVLDEADEMLDMGFREDIESILDRTSADHQTVLFSATMSRPIMAIANTYQNEPKLVKVVRNELTADSIDQLYYPVKGQYKMELMCRLIDYYQLKLILVFSNTKAKVDEIVNQLVARGYQAEGLHGDMRQAARTTVMAKFRSGNTNILVATDVAARGIDVDDVDAVINYDIPLDEEYYVHRIGRTGRAGKSGRAFTFVVGNEKYRLREIQQYTKVKIERGVIPTFADIVGIKKARFIEQVQQTIEEGSLDTFDDIFESLHHAGHSSAEIVAALAKMNMGVMSDEFSEINFAEEESKFRGERRNDYGGRSNDRPSNRWGDRDRGGNRDSRGNNFRQSEGRERIDRSGKPFRQNKEQGMVRLLINIGKDEKITPSHIVGAFAGEAGIPGNQIGHIELHDKFTYVDIPQDFSQRVLKTMNDNTIKGRRVKVEVAK